jgi:hypothetical protein
MESQASESFRVLIYPTPPTAAAAVSFQSLLDQDLEITISLDNDVEVSATLLELGATSNAYRLFETISPQETLCRLHRKKRAHQK